MSIEFIIKNHETTIKQAFKFANNKVRIVSPFIEEYAVNIWLDKIKTTPKIKNILITKFCDKDFLSGSNNLESLRKLINANVEIYLIKNLHTKLYLFDNNISITGSANFTMGGLINNVEYSVKFENEQEYNKKCSQYFEYLLNECSNGECKYKLTLEQINKKESELESIKNDYNNSNKFKSYGKEIKNQKENLIGVLKFEYTSDNRADSNKEYFPNIYNSFYFTCAPYNEAKPMRPKMLSKDKLLFITVMSKDKNGNNAPMIVGRARTYGFNEKNIATAEMHKEHEWTKVFGFYVKLYNIEIIREPIKNCISLLDVKQKMPVPNWRQGSYRQLENVTMEYINNLLDKRELKTYNKIY